MDEVLKDLPCPACEGTEWTLVVGEESGGIEAICADDSCAAGIPLWDVAGLGVAEQDGADWVAGIAERIADAIAVRQKESFRDARLALRSLAAFVRDSQTSSSAAKELADAFGLPVDFLAEPEDRE